MKKVFALTLTVLMVMSMFAGCGSSNTTKTTTEAPAATAAETTAAATTAAETAAAELKTVESGKLIMSTNAAFPPYEMVADDGSFEGIDVEVAGAIAEKLGLPQVTYAADIQKDGNTITVKRMLEDGYMTIKVQTPCLLTCIKELNEPRYMSVAGIVDAYSKPMDVMDYPRLKDDPLIEADTIGLAGSPTNILTSFTPPQKGAGMMLEGADKATCEKLAGILAAKHII